MFEDMIGSNYIENPPKHLFITLIDDKSGPPLTAAETAEYLLLLERSAQLIIAIDRIRRDFLIHPLRPDDYVLRRFRSYVDRASQREDGGFTHEEVNNLIRLTKFTVPLDGINGELDLLFYGSIYRNPTYLKLMATGLSGALLVGALVWSSVEINQRLGAPACRARAHEFAKERMQALEAQAKREGHWTPTIAKSAKDISDGLAAAIAHCDRLIGRPRIKVSPKNWDIEAAID